VRAAQEKLTALGYYAGVVDGLTGGATASATMAFQKVHGLSPDGVLGPITYAALDAPITPPLHGGEALRVEVDLTKQVAYYVGGGELQRIFPVSSGSGEKYRHTSGATATALTPVGAFRVERKIAGVREAPLGILYDPMYFFRGWALHGSNHVPAYPASHGCVRMTRWDATWLAARAPIGMQVLVYGGTHVFKAGEELSKVGVTEPGGDASPSEEPSPPESPTPTPSEEPSTSEQPSASESSTPTPSESPEPSPSDTLLPIDPSEDPSGQ
jgi:lipoprotein-anchoring transpeptidase ErfK/SrfK